MLRRIVSNSVELVKFISELGLKLSRPQAAHVLNMADALLVSDEHKTVASLNRQLVDAKDDSSVVHSFRESPCRRRTYAARYWFSWCVNLSRWHGV